MRIWDEHAIGRFLHGQVDAWNASDRESFFVHYRDASQGNLTIDYVGQPPRDPWPSLDVMWRDQNAKFHIEVHKKLICGVEAACCHANIARDGTFSIPTIELFHFFPDRLHIRYFIGPVTKL